jgi:hypothetical protein
VVVTVDAGLLIASKSIDVTIFAPPIVGSGNDSDGDGFSDDFEKWRADESEGQCEHADGRTGHRRGRRTAGGVQRCDHPDDVKKPKRTSVTFAIVYGSVVSKVQRAFRYTAKRGKIGRAR